MEKAPAGRPRRWKKLLRDGPDAGKSSCETAQTLEKAPARRPEKLLLEEPQGPSGGGMQELFGGSGGGIEELFTK